MIELILYADIDRVAYDRCLGHSPDFRIYALSGYLDAVTEAWDVLALEDYKAVMPLPRRSKYGLAYVYTPVFVQQLGLFSSSVLDADTQCLFYKRAASRYFLMDYLAHSQTRCPEKDKLERINYRLALDRSHAEISQGFNSNRRRILKQDFDDLRIDKTTDPGLFIEACKGGDLSFEPDAGAMNVLERLLRSNLGAIRTWNVFQGDQWVGGLVWTQDHRRITYLFPATSALGKERHVSSFLIDSLIREHEGSGLTLDFEGSMIPGVANFYRSFGAETEVYYHFKSRGYGLF